MNATRSHHNDQEPSTHGNLKPAFIKSVIFHVAIFLIALFGLPFIKKEPLLLSPVSVELVDISELTQTNKPPPSKIKDIPKPKEPEPVKPLPEPEPLKKEPPKPVEPEIKPEPKKDAVPPPEPKKEKPKETPKEKPKPPEPKKEEPKPVKEDNSFDNLLKDLTPEKDKEKPNEQKDVRDDADDGQLANLADKLTMSELDSFRHQLEPCWNIPAGAKYAEDLAVEIRVVMNRDMTVRDVRILDQGRYNRDSAFRAAADSATRALRNPRCQPLRLPADKYDQWKTIVINFDPRNML